MKSRKHVFEDTLLDLMVRGPYSKITVSQLIREVGATRGAFYLHFPHLDACFESLVDRIIQDLALYVAECSVDFLSGQKAVCRFYDSRRDFLTAIHRNNLQTVFLKRAVRYIKQNEYRVMKVLGIPCHESDDAQLVFLMAGYISVLMFWAEREFDLPADVLAEKFTRLISVPLLSGSSGPGS